MGRFRGGAGPVGLGVRVFLIAVLFSPLVWAEDLTERYHPGPRDEQGAAADNGKLEVRFSSVGKADNEVGRVPAHGELRATGEKGAVDPRFRPFARGGKGRIVHIRRVRIDGLKPRTVTVYLPPGYDRDTEHHYPVLYAHDGQFVFRKELAVDRALERLVDEGLVEPHIVVAIHRTADRSQEFKPGEEEQDRTTANEGGGENRPGRRWRRQAPSLELYGKLLVETIKPMIDERFRTRTGRESTSVIGYSLGGLANFYLLMRYPDVFGAVGCMSPSLWWKDGLALETFGGYGGPLPDRLWIDAGTREGRPWEDVPYFIRDIRRAREIALARGMKLGRDLGYLEDMGARHSGWAGGRRMRYALAFLLSDVRPHDLLPTSLSLGLFRRVLSRRHRVTSMSTTVSYGDMFRITWPNAAFELRSSDPAVARVDRKGSLTATGLGSALVVARLGPLVARAGCKVVTLRNEPRRLAAHVKRERPLAMASR